MRVTGSQVIVTEGVKQDGWEANVISVRIVFYFILFFLSLVLKAMKVLVFFKTILSSLDLKNYAPNPYNIVFTRNFNENVQ